MVYNFTDALIEGLNTLSPNSFYHVSSSNSLTKNRISTGREGFHMTQDIQCLYDRAMTTGITDGYVYRIDPAIPLQPLIFEMDLMQWDSRTLAMFLYAKVTHGPIGGGFDEIDDVHVNIDKVIPQKLEVSSQDFVALRTIRNQAPSIINEATIFSIIKHLGYNSIKYLNEAEGGRQYSYIIFGQEAIADIALVDTLNNF